MNANEYQKLAMTTLNPALDKKDVLINSVMGLCGESGEVIDQVKKHLAQGHTLDTEHMAEELGDVAWYLAEAATAIDKNLDDIFEGNIAKLKKRYPEGFEVEKSINREKRVDYDMLSAQLASVIEDSKYVISNLSNASAILYDALPNLNWAGFYLMEDGQLILGPFQGKVACMQIKVGRGVCGTAVEKDETILVKDVHEFPGHIACDSASNSEIVIPLHKDGKVYGVLDIDSPLLARFTEEDRIGLEKYAKVIEESLNR